MFIRCPCGQKFYTSTASFSFFGEVLYVCPKCGGFIPKATMKNLEVA